MKVILKHGNVNYFGNRYTKGDTLDITELFYNSHITRFEKVVEKPSNKAKVITNDEPTKAQSKKTQTKKKSVKK